MVTPKDEADQGEQDKLKRLGDPEQEEESVEEQWEEIERPDYLYFPMQAEEDLYKPNRMNDPEASPRCIFLPTRETLFNMMRACHGVKEAEELWFCKGLYIF